mmetsp:Transcript_11505/g.23835  ORF Transcript_11505/g.23835 Transcript_11505/m.23835 type:complete len:490 (+) Transcript_11505:40-1509(+)
MADAEEAFDVLIVGAGASGIGTGVRLQTLCPGLSYCIIERRSDLGGTWDLFRYPGVRSDSHLWGYAFPFRPWLHPKVIAPGPLIKSYLRDTAEEFEVAPHIRFNEDVASASFSSSDSRWHLTTAEGRRYTGQFLLMTAGYYDYDPPFTPEFEGTEDFQGRILHPQTWPEDADVHGKNVVVIGSGATAVTMIPVMAEKAAKVTMVQRTPTFIVSLPSESAHLKFLQDVSPSVYFKMNRWGRFLQENVVNRSIKMFPEAIKKRIVQETAAKLKGTDVKPEDYIPPYNVWDQRVAVVPDNDWYKAIQKGKVSVVTGHIERFTQRGLLMKDGREVSADMIVTATGMNVHKNLPFGTIDVSVDGERVVSSTRMIYKGCMLSGVPNMAFAFGYLYAGSWTQKSDLTAIYVCRLMKHMRAKNLQSCVPVRDPNVKEVCMHDFSSTYLARRKDDLPKAGATWPWDRPEDYLRDWYRLGWAPLTDKDLSFKGAPRSRL